MTVEAVKALKNRPARSPSRARLHLIFGWSGSDKGTVPSQPTLLWITVVTSRRSRHERLSPMPSSVEFARPDVPRSLFALATSVVPFLALWVLMYFALGISYLLVLALA